MNSALGYRKRNNGELREEDYCNFENCSRRLFWPIAGNIKKIEFNAKTQKYKSREYFNMLALISLICSWQKNKKWKHLRLSQEKRRPPTWLQAHLAARYSGP